MEGEGKRRRGGRGGGEVAGWMRWRGGGRRGRVLVMVHGEKFCLHLLTFPLAYQDNIVLDNSSCRPI